jgi:hypothetical protein
MTYAEPIVFFEAMDFNDHKLTTFQSTLHARLTAPFIQTAPA